MKEPRQILQDKLVNRTQKDLAADIGVSETYLSGVLNGTRNGYGKKILKYLGLVKRVSVTYARAK